MIIIQYFEDYHLKEDNPLEQFKENYEVFCQHWPKYSYHFNGEKISSKRIIDLFYNLPEPLGYGAKGNKSLIAKEVMTMNLIGYRGFHFIYKSDGSGHVYFNEVLFAAIKRFFQEKLSSDNGENNNNNLDHIAKVEADTKLEIEKKKVNRIKKNG